MRDLVITPKQEVLLWISLIGILIFVHTYILSHDIRSWILLNFFLSGLLIVLAMSKAMKIILDTWR